MSARDEILAAVRRNLPRPASPLPDIPRFDRASTANALGHKEHLSRLPEVTHGAHEPVLSLFRRQLEAMGGRSFEVADAAAASAKVAELFPRATVVCSAAAGVTGTLVVEDGMDPHAFDHVEVGVVRSRLGIGEAGAIWLTEADLIVNSLGVLSQHLCVLLDRAAIVETMHDAYDRLEVASGRYGVFMAGPSATADIEGVIVHGAQGARSMTVLLHGEPDR
jgi:L-lactate dehydrogenase complex protein LldG